MGKINQLASFLVNVFVVICSFITIAIPDVPRPRGVAISKASMYPAGADFTCFDGLLKIPFEYVNDDYCDCKDGTDEPGTSACPNGSYHCTNAGHAPQYIPSSRVNDGICDCCDGTDEYDENNNCGNTCREAGSAAREEAERLKKLQEEGHHIYQDYCKQGQDAKAEKQARMDEISGEKAQVEEIKNRLQGVKEELEKPEKEAKEKHKNAWEAEKEKLKAEKEEEITRVCFQDLDKNDDSIISIDEMQERKEFDIDANDEVSIDEAKEYLEDQEQVGYDFFKASVWPNIKEIYKTPGSETPPEVEEQIPPPSENLDDNEEPDYDDDDDNDYLGDDEDMDDHHVDSVEKGDQSVEEFPMPEYDAETQNLILSAEQSRNEFNEADRKFRDVEKEYNELNSVLTLDLAPNMEYFPLKGMCYEYTDREYTYKLCPFERASQRNKNGGAETSLGTWGMWDGPGDSKYTQMKFERGQNCWNGPDRSVRVLVECGLNNEVYDSSEPNRCEYQFKFRTPAACSSIPKIPATHPDHVEL